MIKPISERPTKPLEIDLTGPEGDIYHLLGLAKELAKKRGLDHNRIVREIAAGDKEHSIQTFDRYFGEHVVLYR